MEQLGVGGVEVLWSAPVCVGQVGVSASDEAEDLAVVNDREDDPVTEPVDQPAGAGCSGHARGEHLLVGNTMTTQMVDQARPTVRGLTRTEVWVFEQVGAE